MRFRVLTFLLSLTTLASACGDKGSTEPQMAQASQGWQIVIQSNSAYADPVYAKRTDAFNVLSLDDFYYARSVVIDMNHADTIWIGYAVSSWAARSDFSKDTIEWSFTGSMVPSAPGINFGPMASMYEIAKVDTAWRYVGEPVRGSQNLMVSGDDFKFTRSINMRSGYTTALVVVYRPFVCSNFVARRLLSDGLTESQTDNVHSYKYGLSAPEIKVTCNPRAPTALRVPGVDGNPERVVDAYRQTLVQRQR